MPKPRFSFSFRCLALLNCLLVLLLTVGLSACGEKQPALMDAVKQRGKLVAGVKYDSKPFGYLDTDGQLKGFDIDMMHELAKRILGDADAVEFQQVLSSTRVIAINSGSVDVVAATMTITPDREKVIDFSKSYFTAHQAVIVPIGSPVEKLDDLQGKTVLFVMGTTSERNIRSRLPQAKYIGFKTSTDAFSALKAGRGDAMTTDDTILSGFLADTCGFRPLAERLSDEPYGLGFRQDPNSSTSSLRQRVDRELAAMEKDGTLENLKRKWVDAAFQPKPCPQ
jgi:putative glutamine transport system substrate-binding protein